MPTDAPPEAPRLVGRYEILEKLAEGGMGAVYRGRDPATGGAVAVKVLAPRAAASAVLLDRFRREFHAARSLDHPHLVLALDFGQEGGVAYLVMEFVAGGTLA